jgi:drug/metabolite transporter (DMT)-like permease
MLITLPGFLAMSVSIISNWSTKNKGKIKWVYVITIALFDVLSHFLNLNGLIFAGSSIFTLIFSSVIVFTAIFAKLIIGTDVSYGQWIGICVVFSGLSLVSIDANFDGKEVVLGVVMIFIGSTINAMNNVLSEYLLVLSEDPISAELLCTLLGMIGSAVNLSWQLYFTLPNFQKLVVEEVESHHGNVKEILLLYFMLFTACAIQATCFYNLLSIIGSVSTGLLRSVKTVLIFVLSSFLFCSTQQSQCLTLLKIFSLVIVIVGFIIYSKFTNYNNLLNKKEQYINLNNEEYSHSRLKFKSNYEVSEVEEEFLEKKIKNKVNVRIDENYKGKFDSDYKSFINSTENALLL